MHDISGKAERRVPRLAIASLKAVVPSVRTARSAAGLVGTSARAPLQGSRLADRLSTTLALGCVLMISGCAPGAVQSELRPEMVHAAATSQTNPEEKICRPDRAFFAPQPAPDCGFGRSTLRTLDPQRWASLKLEYERRCFQNAEKVVRERLRRLQAAIGCDAGSARL